jgi:hypothetical protein
LKEGREGKWTMALVIHHGTSHDQQKGKRGPTSFLYCCCCCCSSFLLEMFVQENSPFWHNLAPYCRIIFPYPLPNGKRFLLRPLSSARHPIPMKTRNRVAGGIFNCPLPPHPRWDIVEGEPDDSTTLVDIFSNKMKMSLKLFSPSFWHFNPIDSNEIRKKETGKKCK